VPIPGDERFEAYLKEFRPLVPEALSIGDPRHRARRKVVLWAEAAAAIAILAAATALHLYTQRVRVAKTTDSAANTDRDAGGEPLTMRSANALMVKAPSFKVLVDEMAFRSQGISLPKGKLSAIGVLGKEKIKL
jgi:hypothetical protein